MAKVEDYVSISDLNCEDFIKKFPETIDWTKISKHQYLSEDFKGNDIFSNKKISDQLQIHYIESNLNNKSQGFNFIESILELKYLNEIIMKRIKNMNLLEPIN